MFARPGGWSDFYIIRKDHDFNQREVIIEDMTLEIFYEYSVRPMDDMVINLSVTKEDPLMPGAILRANELTPYFQLSLKDNNDMDNGYGAIKRYYKNPGSQSVTITAPKIYGDWIFEKWTDRNGVVDPEITRFSENENFVMYTVPLAYDQDICAQYRHSQQIANKNLVDGKIDSDLDSMPDEWEIANFGNLDKTGFEDSDLDGVSDLDEYQAGLNPNNSDTDGDGIPDGKEIEYGFDPNLNESTLLVTNNSDYLLGFHTTLNDNFFWNPNDVDGDGVSNSEEYLNGTDPTVFDYTLNTNGPNTDENPVSIGGNGSTQEQDVTILPETDSDNDGMPDAWELAHGLKIDKINNDSQGNPDGDLLTNIQEYQNNMDPNFADHYSLVPETVDNDKDDLPDSWEMANFGNLDQNANGNPDSDMLLNIHEYQFKKNPNSRDLYVSPLPCKTNSLLPAGHCDTFCD